MHFDEIDDKEFEVSDAEWALHAANVAYQGQRNEEAAELFAQALAHFDQTFGDAHPEMPGLLWNYGNTLYNLHLFREAIPLYNRLINIQVQKLGVDDTKVVATLFRMAIVYERIGNFADAERTYEQALASAKIALPPDHPLLKTLEESCEGMARRTAARLEGLVSEPLTEPLQEEEWEQYAAPSTLSKAEMAALNAIPTPIGKKGGGKGDDTAFITELGKQEAEAAERSLPRRKQSRLFELSQKMDEFTQNSAAAKILHSRVMMFILTVVFLLTAGSWFVIFKPTQSRLGRTDSRVIVVQHDEDLYGKTLLSADRQEFIQIDKNGEAQLTKGGKLVKGASAMLSGDLSDFLRVVPGSFFHKEIWFEQVPGGLLDEKGTILYFPDAPEQTIVSHMKKFAEFAESYYGKNQSYPKDATDCQSFSTFSYINPFTHSHDAPYFSSMYTSNRQTQLDRLEEQATKGEKWINEPDPRPGAINCCALVLNQMASKSATVVSSSSDNYSSDTSPTATSVATDLFIRGCDRDGRYIQSSTPGTVFVLQLDQGKSKSLLALDTPPDVRLGDTDIRILIVKDATERATFSFLRSTLPPIVALFSILCGVAAWGASRKQDSDQKLLVAFRSLAIGSASLLVIWYVICMFG